LGKLGPQSPKQEKNASVWQAKIKAAKILNHEPTCNAGGTQSPLKAGSVGDLKEKKETALLRQPTKSGFLFSGVFAAYHNIFCLPSLHNDVM